MIPAGGTLVVGGPISDAGNGNPVFDLALGFGPNLQNPGFLFAPADGIALFNVPAASITAGTVPVDAFIYGGAFFSTNSNGLIDPTGTPGAINYTTPLFSAGSSAEFNGSTWVVQAAPTPGASLIPETSTGTLTLLGLALLGIRSRRAA